MRISQFKAIFSAVLLCGTLTACESYNSQLTPLVADTDPVALRLTEASEKAASALDKVAAIEQYRNPLPEKESFVGAPPPLAQPITLTWAGPVEPAIQTLAAKAGYSYQVAGVAPSVPLTVMIDVYEKQLIDILRDIGLQLGNRADVAVGAQNGVIQMRYASTEGLF